MSCGPCHGLRAVDVAEYRLQVDGLADALADPEVSEALLAGQIAVAALQWSGAGKQEMTLAWQRMLKPGDVQRFAADARAMRRAYQGSDTAVGDALAFAAGAFAAVADCRHRIIDISGDGPQNAGGPLGAGRAAVLRAGTVINAIAIEDPGQSVPITSFYRNSVITHGGFVITARSHRDYPRAIRAKLLRELTTPAF
jgi:Ca-activated chloride channel family protein